jgi:hypothetical protein
MKKLSREAGVALVGGGLIALAMATSGQAKADVEIVGHKGDQNVFAYQAELAQTGWSTTQWQAMQNYTFVCARRELGFSERQIENGFVGVTPETAVVMTLSAEWHMCPWYWVPPLVES